MESRRVNVIHVSSIVGQIHTSAAQNVVEITTTVTMYLHSEEQGSDRLLSRILRLTTTIYHCVGSATGHFMSTFFKTCNFKGLFSFCIPFLEFSALTSITVEYVVMKSHLFRISTQITVQRGGFSRVLYHLALPSQS